MTTATNRMSFRQMWEICEEAKQQVDAALKAVETNKPTTWVGETIICNPPRREFADAAAKIAAGFRQILDGAEVPSIIRGRAFEALHAFAKVAEENGQIDYMSFYNMRPLIWGVGNQVKEQRRIAKLDREDYFELEQLLDEPQNTLLHRAAYHELRRRLDEHVRDCDRGTAKDLVADYKRARRQYFGFSEGIFAGDAAEALELVKTARVHRVDGYVLPYVRSSTYLVRLYSDNREDVTRVVSDMRRHGYVPKRG